MLLNTILSKDSDRAAIAVEVLTQWLHDTRAKVPLSMLLRNSSDPFSLTLAARGLGWLGESDSVALLAELLLDEFKPFVARIAVIQSLQAIGEAVVGGILELAQHRPRPSVAEAAT